MSHSTRNLAAVHLVANALLLLLAYYWLGIGESRTASLLWSTIVALLLICLTCLLQGFTFAYLARRVDLPSALRAALRNLVPILTAAAVILALYLLLAWWANYSTQPAYNISSWLTLKLRKPVRPNSVYRVFKTVTWLVRWVVLPVFALPWIAAISSNGWRAFRPHFGGRRLYWLQSPVLLLCALWVPFLLLDWVPHMSTFTMEMVSFVMRLLAAYLLFVAAWLVLAFLTSGGRPAVSQPSTAANP